MPAAERFSPDYALARERFRRAAAAAGAGFDSLLLSGRGPRGEALGIDIAWLGPARAGRVLLHSCGLHGVEGFAGAAVQLALLAEPPPLAADQALVLVHALNPFGMAWLRRVNEHNVDLNRNCPGPGEAWCGAPPFYRALDPLLNPASPPASDGFYRQAVGAVLRHGFRALQAAVAGGQYEYPKGLFYGGRELEEGPRRYRQWLQRRLRGVEQVWAVDVHTGLGRGGRQTLFVEAAGGERAALQARLGPDVRWVQWVEPGMRSGYLNRGGLAPALVHWLPGVRVTALTQEFGTRGALRVLHAMREENRWHHYGAGTLDHPSKRRLRTAFCPSSRRWREGVLARGTALVRRLLSAPSS